jgi:hypothetical protein
MGGHKITLVPKTLLDYNKKVSLYTKWFQWIVKKFTNIINGDLWTTPTFCSNVMS